MPIAKLKEQISRLKTPAVAVEPAEAEPDERDAVIERLEAELADERDLSSTLRNTVDELGFQKTTLETSYATQLNDARERTEAAEATLAELQAELDEVGGEDILEVLATAREDLERVTAERDRLYETLRNPVTRPRSPAVEAPIESVSDLDVYSVDELLEDAVWAKEQARIDKEQGRTPHVAVDETLAEEMLPGDLVFPVSAAED